MAHPSATMVTISIIIKNIPPHMAIPSVTLAIISATYSTYMVITPATVAFHQPHSITHNGGNIICHKIHSITPANILLWL